MELVLKKCGLKIVMKIVLILATKTAICMDLRPEKNHRLWLKAVFMDKSIILLIKFRQMC